MEGLGEEHKKEQDELRSEMEIYVSDRPGRHYVIDIPVLGSGDQDLTPGY
jgi:hypothetical protein